MRPPDHRSRGLLLTAPAVVLTLAVTATGLAALLLTSLGLMPLVGRPRLGVSGFGDVSSDLLLAVRESLVIATTATVLAAVVGLGVASAVLGSASGRRALVTVIAGIVPVPHLVGATAVLLLLSDGGVAARLLAGTGTGWPAVVGGTWPVAPVAELVWKESAFVALVVVASVGPRLPAMLEAAAVLGAGPGQRWRRVMLPLAAPAWAASSLIVWLYGIGTYEVPWLLGRSYPEPLPVMAYRLFGSIDPGARPQAAAVATTATALALVGAALAVVGLRRLGAAR